MIKKLLTAIFGNVTWTSPQWINYLRSKAGSNPQAFWRTLGALIILGVGAYVFIHWYINRPQAQLIVSQITPPKITANEKHLVPNPVKVEFGTITAGEFNAKPVAPISEIGKDIIKNISMTPEMPGKWHWNSDSELSFTPTMDWPAGQPYSIIVNKDFFAKNAKMAGYAYSFSTLPFDAAIDDYYFYQDPVNSQVREAIASVMFSYPVDAESFEKNVSLAYQAQAGLTPEPVKYTISYDQNKRTAYIHSETLSLPAAPRYLTLTVNKGVKASTGSSRTVSVLSKNILIPDAGSYFKIKKLTATIVRNPKDQPEQVLIFKTSIGVAQTELDKAVHVYVLPKDYPATIAQAAQTNYEWKEPGEVTADILAKSQAVELHPIPADRNFATLHSYTFKAATPSYLYIKVDKGVRAFGDFVLSDNFVAIQKTPVIPQEITFLHKGALLALGTEEKLSVLVRGLSAVKFNFNRVLPDDINHLITQTSGDFNNPAFINASFNQENISEISSQIQSFDASDAAKAQYTALDLSKYHNAKQALGLFLLQADGYDAEKKYTLDIHASRLILITDMGLIVKDNNDNSHDVFVQSITNGTPIANASVSILGKNGVAILTKTTDAQGHANFPSLKDFINEREPTVYVAHNGNDVSFIPYNRFDRQLNFSRFDIGGIYSNAENQTPLTAYIFSDRGIYRPGDLAHIGMIVKQPYVMPQSAGLPLEVSIVDPRGVTVKDEKITLNDSGYLTLDFQTDATAPTGQYSVNLFIVKDNHASNLIGSTTINVAEFLPDRLRITEHLTKEETHGWISPADLSTKVNLWNLYGAPAADHKITGRIVLTPKTIKFSEYPQYTFFDPLYDPKSPPKTFTETLSATQTDAQGQAELALNLERFDKATYTLTVFAQGFEAEGGRSVTTQTSALISPLHYFIGYKPDGDLNYIKQNAARSVHLIAINPQLQQQELGNIKLQLFSQHPVTTLVKKEDGSYQYQSIMQSTEISSNPFTISASGNDYNLPTQDIGDYIVSLVDDKGTELTHFNYSVVGAAQVALPKNAELSVKLNKSEFTPGEDIEIQITSPYTGAGLITIERDKVHAFQWFKANTTASVQKIHIPNDFQGNGYVNIAFVRDLNSPEIYMSPLSYSVAPFKVTHQNHELKIDLSIPTLARPGDDFPITYKTNKPGKIVVFAVDEGILQVTDFKTPDPIAFFFQKYALEVNTQQIVDQILPKFISERELSTVGGDHGKAFINRNLNPFKRKSEAPVVFWSGVIDSDTTPKQLTYHVPDYFNGSLRVMAVAVATDAVGSTENSAQVRGDFVINPNVPTFVAPGDEFEVTASIANNVKDASGKITVALNASPQVTIIGASSQSIDIPSGEERSVRYQLRANNQLGDADLQFTATLNDKNSKMSSSLSVRPATPYMTSLTSGYTKDANKLINLDRVLYPEYRFVEAAASPSPLILVTGLQHYLDKYPYGCTEQIVSEGFPSLVMNKQAWFANDAKKIADNIATRIQILSQRQMSGGSFAYWPEVGSTNNNDFASVYAMHFLTEARTQGYTVPNDVYSSGIAYLKDYVTQDVNNLDDARWHAYAIYILTRNEIVTTNYLTNLQLSLDQHKDFDWHADITSAFIAATYQMLQNSNDAARIIKFFKPKFENNITMWGDFYNQDIGNVQYLYLIANHFPDRLKDVDEKYVLGLVNTLNSESISTVLAAYTSLALASYGDTYPTTNDSTLSIKDDNNNVLASSIGLYQKAELSEKMKAVIFANPNKTGFFYQITQAGFDKNLPEKPLNQGIEVFREYHNAEDKTLSDVQLGDEIIVHIRVRALDNVYHSNIALVDLLPGGFEVVGDSVKPQDMDYVDAREDRVIYFGGVGPDSKDIVYRIKATNKGKYTVPPMFGMSMYNAQVKSLGTAGNMEVR